jgi:hypothetical protein
MMMKQVCQGVAIARARAIVVTYNTYFIIIHHPSLD